MKKFIILFIAFAIIATACHKKAIPVIAERKEFPAPPKSTKPAINPNTPEFIAAGKTLYEIRCNRCHALKDPGIYNTERWTIVLKTMIPRARLDNDQAQQVTAYVMKNAKK